jgi:hypothetical protein
MFGLTLLNGWTLLLGGSALVAAPILIHLLSRRKFRIVDWAAIDFLLEADRRNRRRIRLENLLLLLLRCLVVILLALLVARPRLHAAGFLAGTLASAGIDRIVVLDDSLSMAAADPAGTPFDLARHDLEALAQGLRRQHAADTFTLILTSHPDGPFLLDRKPLAAPGADQEIPDALEKLHPTDLAAQLVPALAAVQKRLTARDAARRTVVYIVSDLRDRDWRTPAGLPPDQTAPGLVRSLAAKADGLFVLDVGSVSTGSNLAVTDILPADKALIPGVETPIDITVINHGRNVEADLPVLLYADKAVPLRQTIASLEPGQSATVRFNCTFRPADWVKLRAVADRPGPFPQGKTARLYPARLDPAVPVLLVDGNPLPEPGAADSFFLRTALASRGPYPTGYRVTTVAEDQFDRASLDDYQAIFLCNCALRHLALPRLRDLVQWTRRGGGLVIFLGDNVDPVSYNQLLYRPAAAAPATQPDPAQPAYGYDDGLLPVRLLNPCGDPEPGAKSVGLSVEAASHPVFGLLAGGDNPFLASVKFYRWWGVQDEARRLRRLQDLPDPLARTARDLGLTADDYQLASPLIPRPLPARSEAEVAFVLGAKQARTAAAPSDPHLGPSFFAIVRTGFDGFRQGTRNQGRVLARFTDDRHSPAILEQAFGAGRVLLCTSTANSAWNNWPGDTTGSFPATMLNLARYVQRGSTGQGLLTVGQTLTCELDTTRYKSEADLSVDAQPAQPDQPTALRIPARILDPADPRRALVQFDQANSAGFYLLRLTPHRPGGVQDLLFAANIDPTETDLTRTDLTTLRHQVGEKVIFLGDRDSLVRDAIGSGTEIWRQVLLALAVVLCVEQVLAFTFGRRR